MNGAEFRGFQFWDGLVLGGYFCLLVVTGLVFTRRQTDTDDYFRASRRIPMLAAAVSFLATALSAATFIGGPQQAFVGDLTYLSANLGSIIAAVVVALFFVPAFFKHDVPTVYGLLRVRFGVRSSMAAGGTFLAGRVFASGARLYIAALPASWIIYGDIGTRHLLISIAVLTLVGTTYTLAGGIRSVILTDVIQTVIFVGTAVVACVVLLDKIPLGLGGIIDALKHPAAGEPSKLTVFKLGLDGLNAKYTLLTAVFGFTLLGIGSYGTDQDMAQRMLSCRDAKRGSLTAITGILIGLPVTALFMGIGLLLFIFYRRPDIMAEAAPVYAVGGGRQIFLEFLLHEIPVGLTGLMMAGLFAAALSSLNSALNAMSSSLINDFYRRLRPGRDERHYLKAGRSGVALCGAVIGLFAVGSAFWQEAHPEATLIDFALQVMIFAYAGLVAVYLTALFTRRGNETSVIAALGVGFAVALTLTMAWGANIAYAWTMLISTGLAFAVCCLGGHREPEVKPV